MYGRDRFNKPPAGTPLDAGSPLVAGLAGAWIFNEGTGLPMTYGAAHGLVAANTMTWAVGPGRGPALQNTGTSHSVEVSVGNGTPLDVTGTALSFGGWVYPTADSTYQAIIVKDDGNTAADRQYLLELPSGSTTSVSVTLGGSSGFNGSISISPGWSLNSWNFILATYDGSTIRAYVNGIQAGTQALSGSVVHVANSSLWMGYDGGQGAAGLNGYLDQCFVWSRVLSAPEVLALYQRPYQMWRSRAEAAVLYDLTAGITSITPSQIPSNHPGAITLSIHGTGLDWTPGTPGSPSLSVSGVTGTALVANSQTITDANDATIEVTTGSGTGTATVSDGTHSATFNVAATSLTVAAPTMGATGTYGVTLTGVGTLWPTGSQPSLFTVSGISGASISAISVSSNTQATATIALGSSQSGGTLTVTDTSTDSAATLTVEAAYAGSLHLTNTCQFQQSSGSATISNQATASLSFFVEIHTDAGLNLGTGTHILNWSSGSGGATYYPATNTLGLSLYGQSGALSATIPVQIGTKYHVAMSWESGSQVIYLNGIKCASDSLTVHTSTLGSLQFGCNAGGAATDHYLSDVAVWDSYALSASDALALANKTSTPLQIGTPASAWWPLGGGTDGGTPTISDPWFTDFSGNGNGILVEAGSLSAATYAAPLSISNPITVAPYVSKWGKLIFFGTSCAAPAANGTYPLATITAVNANPTVYCNGTQISIGAPTWMPGIPSVTNDPPDTPFVAYLAQCGSVQNLAIDGRNANYTSAPTATISNTGTGGSGLAVGTATMATGLTSYSGGTVGSGYNEPPTITFTDPGGGSGANGYCVIYEGAIAAVYVTSGGSGYSAQTTVAFGSGNALGTPIISGGAITGVNITCSGSGYGNPPGVTVPAPSGTSGPTGNISAQALAIVYDANGSDGAGTNAGGIRAIVPLTGTLPALGSGYSGSTVAVTVSAPGSGTQATGWSGNVNQYPSYIPVTNAGSAYNEPPTVTLSGGGATTQALVYPLMSGSVATSLTGTLTSSSASVTGIYPAIQTGWTVTGYGIPVGTTVQAYNGSAGTMTLSADATESVGTFRVWQPTTAGTPTPAPILVSGTVTASSASVTGISGTFGLAAGQSISGTGIPAGATIQTVNSSTAITLSTSGVTASGAQALSVLDTFTYTAPAGWLTATYNGDPVGSVQAVS